MMDQTVWQILKIFLNGKQDCYSALELKVCLEQTYGYTGSIKMVYSHIQRLNTFFEEMFGMDQAIKSLKAKGYKLNKEIISDGQLRFIYDMLSSNPSLSNKECEELFSRLTVFSSKQQLDRLHLLPFNQEQDHQLFLKISTLVKAIDQKKPILFEYVRYDYTPSGEVVIAKSKNGNDKQDQTGSTYFVSPYEIMMQSGRYYLLAYNSIRKESLSIYRIDRMEQVRTSKRPFEDIREMWDMASLKQQAINMYFSNEVIDFKFNFDPLVFRTIVDQFGQRLQVSKDYRGKNVGYVREVTLTEGLMGWIMMLGNHITILEPAKLKEQVIARLEESLSNYK